MDKTKQEVMIKDSKDLKNILIQINMDKNTTTVISNFSAWENLALIIEGLGATAQKCIREGHSKAEIQKTIETYISKVISSYTLGLKT
ncbi:hypothetical protein HYT59_01645 [Candidatus Woesebacteria bacterium]|nr:hypothetical protein [Candidatus Woesebacteria bacterium]